MEQKKEYKKQLQELREKVEQNPDKSIAFFSLERIENLYKSDQRKIFREFNESDDDTISLRIGFPNNCIIDRSFIIKKHQKMLMIERDYDDMLDISQRFQITSSMTVEDFILAALIEDREIEEIYESDDVGSLTAVFKNGFIYHIVPDNEGNYMIWTEEGWERNEYYLFCFDTKEEAIEYLPEILDLLYLSDMQLYEKYQPEAYKIDIAKDQTDEGLVIPGSDIQRENKLRREIKKTGYELRKSRVKTPNFDNMGRYQIIDVSTNAVIHGSRFELTLDDVEFWIDKSK